MDQLRQELRYALRSIRRTPLASTIIVATLSVGIALVTTFYSLINTALFRPLPFPDAGRLIRVAPYPASLRAHLELTKLTRSLERLGLYEESRSILVVGDEPIAVPTAGVDSSVFAVLGIKPKLGRLPSAREISDRLPVVVIGERLWQMRFGGDSGIIGRSVQLDGQLRRVVAVMPKVFTFPIRAQAWYPLQLSSFPETRYASIGKLRLGVTVDAVMREARVVGDRLRRADPVRYQVGRVGPAGGLYPLEDVVDRGWRIGTAYTALFVIGPAVCALLIACINVAALMLARLSRRRGEFIVRAALGASRWRIVRQTLLESAVFAVLAGVAGCLLSAWGVRLMLAMLPAITRELIPGWSTFGVDLTVLAFAIGVALLTVLVFGLWPARATTGFDLARGLKSNADQGFAGGEATNRLHLPVVLELTFAVMLFVGASVLVRSYHDLTHANRGYALTDRYQVGLTYEPARDSVDLQYVRNLEDIRSRAEVLSPGMQVASSAQAIRARGDTTWIGLFTTDDGRATFTQFDFNHAAFAVSDNYFAALDIPVIAGRTFGSTDDGGALAIVVSRELARRAWGDANPLGRTLSITYRGTRATVVGVVGDVFDPTVASGGSMDPKPDLYLSMRQSTAIGSPMARLVVHSRMGPASVSSAVQASLKSLGRAIPIEVMTLADEEARRGTPAVTRLMSSILGTLAIIGFVLSMMGIYGVVAFAVEQRTREIGVRVALGATGSDVVAHMMKGGLKLVGIGVGLGILGAIANSRLLESMVVGTTSAKLATTIAVGMVFMAIALVACWFPARRAAALDPLKALRSE
jgi:predicted permease